MFLFCDNGIISVLSNSLAFHSLDLACCHLVACFFICLDTPLFNPLIQLHSLLDLQTLRINMTRANKHVLRHLTPIQYNSLKIYLRLLFACFFIKHKQSRALFKLDNLTYEMKNKIVVI